MFVFFFFSSRRRHTRCSRDWSSDVCSSDLPLMAGAYHALPVLIVAAVLRLLLAERLDLDRKSTRLNSSHGYISYAVFCLEKKKKKKYTHISINNIMYKYTVYVYIYYCTRSR